jgi:ubiquinone/menaquinone biosynthesis C-methylase UbiE
LENLKKKEGRMRDKREEFWKKRSKNYEKLEWAIKGGYLHAFLDAGEFHAGDNVLDIGTGTGIIAHTISPYVDKVVGIDISSDMLSHAFEHRTNKEEFVKMDATKLDFGDESFSKVTARMVFHHILSDTQKAMDECYRVLRPGGKMIFSEGVPPTERVKPFYSEMFKLKEERLTFMDGDLSDLMENSGFRNIQKKLYWSKGSSIRNWLGNSGLPAEVQERIFRMHLEMHEHGKEDYNMVIENGDCLIDMKFVILVGEK